MENGMMCSELPAGSTEAPVHYNKSFLSVFITGLENDLDQSSTPNLFSLSHLLFPFSFSLSHLFLK